MTPKEQRAYELRLTGKTFKEIAKELNYADASGAYQAYQRAREAWIFEPIEELRQLELLRLDDLHKSIWDNAMLGHLPSVNMVLKIMERRTKLLGLDHPEKVETNSWNFDSATIDAEVQKMMNIMTEREEAYFLRRDGEVRQEMRSQFEIEKRLEKELASKENAENARAAVLKMLERDDEEKIEWKLSGNA